MKKYAIRLLIVLAVAAAAWGGYVAVQRMPQRQQQIPTTEVRQGDVIVRTYARGELRAVRSATLVAPNLFGTVQITRLAPLGAFARDKDLIVEFDDAEVQSRLEEKHLEIEQLDEQTKKSEADLAIRGNQDQVELLRARYSVRRAELEVKRNELISAIDAKKNLLTLEESKRRLQQLEVDIKSRREQAEAELAVLRERKNKALLEMARERSRLAQVKVLSPMSGLVAIRQSRGGHFFMPGMQLPDFREGDQLSPGMPVADILDLSELEVVARIGELDRANLHEGQEAMIALDALANKRVRGKIKSMSGTASANIFSSDPAKKFDVLFSIDMEQLLSHLGASKQQIAQIMAQAEANRKRPAPASFSMASVLGGMGGGMPGMGGGMPGAVGGFPGAGGNGPAGPMVAFQRPGGEGGEAEGGEGGSARRAGAGARRPGGDAGAGGTASAGGANMTDEQRQKMREELQKALGGRNMQDLSAGERQKIFAQLRTKMGGAAGKKGESAKGDAKSERKSKAGAEGKSAKGGQGEEAAQGAERRARRGGEENGRPGGENGFARPGGSSQFSEKDLANAKLPPPPEEDDQLDVLLRPGLLSDVEIIVEKIPNAVHLPAQAVFEKEGKLVAYVRGKGGRFEERVLQPMKRSESTMVIREGLKKGEVVALADPTAQPGTKKGAKKGGGGGGGGGGVGAAPVGGGRKGGM